MSRRLLGSSSSSSQLAAAARLHVSSHLCWEFGQLPKPYRRIPPKNSRAAVLKGTRDRSRPLTYEQAKYPERIGTQKSWLSWNTAGLSGESVQNDAGVVNYEDQLIRIILRGTFTDTIVSDCVIKRQCNTIRVAFVARQRDTPGSHPRAASLRTAFLIGYVEELLSLITRCVVKLEVQVVDSEVDMVFKFI